MKLNVCLVAPLPPPYGGIAHWSGLVTRYAKSRPEVDIKVVNTAPRWRSIHDLSFFKRAVGGFLQMVRDLYMLLRSVSAGEVDVIHLTTSGQLAVFRDIGVLAIAKAMRIPLVYHIRFGRVPLVLAGGAWEGVLIARVIRSAEVVLAIDETTGAAVRSFIPEANVLVVPNCVDYSILPKGEDKRVGPKVALFVGWVIPTKGIVELLAAWSSLDSEGWVLRVAGPVDDAYLCELKGKFPSNSVQFLGELSHAEAMKEMAECNLFVLPSYTEGFPNAVVEAMALGKPVVSTRVGAIPEMLDGGTCGVLVEPRDTHELASALQALIKNDIAREILGGKASDRARVNYSIDSVFQSYLSIWGSFVDRTANK